MPTNKELKRLERMFGEQLGWNPYRQPLYKWVRAGEPWVPFIKTDGFGGMQYKFQERETPLGATLYVPEAIVEMSRFAAWLDDNQWVLGRWFLTPKDQWEAMFHGLLPWPHRGLYYAGNAHLDLGELPDTGNTEYAIQMIQKDRLKTFDDWIKQTENGMDRQERHADALLDDKLRDLMTAYGNPRPGKRGGHVSHGGIGESPILLTQSGKDLTV